jgi:energy-coupling factor transport system ATP-binding protein
MVGEPAAVMGVSPVHPPVVALGRAAGWRPLPLSVRDARRMAAPLRERLATAPAPARTPVAPPEPQAGSRGSAGLAGTSGPAGPLAVLDRVSVRRGQVRALDGVSLSFRSGEITALMGRNGAGKSTLLGALVGLHAPNGGSVSVGGLTPHRTAPASLLRRVGLVPQEPRDLLYCDTVAAECAAADADAGAMPGACRALVERLLPGIPDAIHPRDLSEGQRLTLALAVVLTARPGLVLLDEPTRGLDYAAKARLVEILRGLAESGHGVVLATHDVELAAELAHRTVILAEGEPVADGATDAVVVSSPAFAPQIAKIIGTGPWLTVQQVVTALGLPA